MSHVKPQTAENLHSQSHLEEIGETYFQHMGFALSFSWKMLKAGFCCTVHAFYPEFFKKTGSTYIAILYDQMVINRHKLKDMK